MSEENKDVEFSKDEEAAMEKDIEEAKQKLVSKSTADAIATAKEEAKAELQKEQELEQLKKQNEELQQQMKAKEEETSKTLDTFKQKLNEMAASRKTVQNEDPFENKQPPQNASIDELSDEQIRQIEEDHAREFFGEENFRHFKRGTDY